jgi:hypothetical protein
MTWQQLAASAALATALGCASAGGRAGKFNNYDRNRITRAEILDSHATDALTCVRRLRGEFLSNRGRTSLLLTNDMLPVVYLDQMQLGSFEVLATIPTSEISEIRLYRAWEAAYKFGRDKTTGVVQVITYLPEASPAATDSSRAIRRRPLLGWPP